MRPAQIHIPKVDAATGPAPGVPSVAVLRGPVLLAADIEGISCAPTVAARLLADRFAQPLHVVSVAEPRPVYTAAPEVALAVPTLGRERRAACERVVRRELARVMESGRSWALHFSDGSPTREICRTAREIGASVIVLGAAPHQRGRRIVSGVRATEVLRRAPCAVLSIAPGFTALPRRIVAAIDFSPASIHAAQTALLLAGDDAILTLVHVQPPFPISHELRGPSGEILGGDASPLFERVREGLRASAPSPVTIETRVESGAAASRVVSIGEELAADLVTVGTHGPGRAERFFVGSVAADILHLASCSVLATPVPPTAERARLEYWMS